MRVKVVSEMAVILSRPQCANGMNLPNQNLIMFFFTGIVPIVRLPGTSEVILQHMGKKAVIKP